MPPKRDEIAAGMADLLQGLMELGGDAQRGLLPSLIITTNAFAMGVEWGQTHPRA